MSDLNTLQQFIVSTEVNLAKTMATKSINNTNSYINDLEKLKIEYNNSYNKVNNLMQNIKVIFNRNNIDISFVNS